MTENNDSTNSRNEKRFELVPNRQGQVDIIDHVESEEKGAICIYNDLGVLPFTSAPALCDLLNELHDKCEFFENENENLKITINARDVLIKVCEKKFRELGFIITVDDDGYVIE